ncbi:MAG: endonuclease/exonuclease/phosphatase family protein [Saprospiraceae bacterium]|nr:endonuclease/exonuclease/phosphatase family protein [Saprospiraceae bacterium]
MIKTLKVGTFNAFNLVNPNEKYYGNRAYSESDFNKKIAWQGQQLDKMKADIVGFQEVFHGQALRKMVNSSEHLKDCYIVAANPNGQSPSVALASKYPILETEIFDDLPELDIDGNMIPITKFSKPVLKAVIELEPGKQITVFVAHLKSKRPSFGEKVDRNDPVEQARGAVRSLVRRSVEACGLREILVNHSEYNQQPVIIMGDLNDASLAVSTRVISGEPPMRYLKFEDKKKAWDVLFYHAKDIQARKSFHDFYYTHIHNGHYEALDHIMVSQELVAENPNAIGQVRNVAIFNDHLIDETLSGDSIPHWQSDHGQVVAHIEFK